MGPRAGLDGCDLSLCLLLLLLQSSLLSNIFLTALP